MPGTFVAAVLTGGASRRMGRDKAFLPVEGLAMAERVAGAASGAGAVDVVCIGARVGDLAHLPDDRPGDGPLPAVVSAVRWAAGRPVVVLACDLLHPDAAAIRSIAQAPPEGCDVAVPVVERREQWLHACWWPASLASLEAAVAGGERAVHRAAASLRVHRMAVADPAPYADADTPGDLPVPDR